MMKRLLFLFVVSIMAGASYAQSLSDDKVVEIIMAEQKKGTPQQEIATKLMRQGVTLEQLQRVKSKVQEDKALFVSTDEDVESSFDRSRKKTDAVANTTTTYNKNKTKKSGKASYSADAKDYKKDENTFLIPDDETIFVDELNNIFAVENTDEITVFGRDIFNNELLTFEPSMNIPTPTEYVLGAGDEIIIDVWGTSQFNVKEAVSPDGKVFVDGVGLLHLSGLTVKRAEDYIKEKLGEVYGGSQISLSLGTVRSVQVQVHGEVVAPGTYTVSAFSTAFNALYAAGGISEVGTLRDIKVYRGGKEIASIDVYEYILNGKTASDVRLQENDVISVGAYQNIVELAGKVKRPMKYEMKADETLLDAVSYAGGFAGDAYTENLNVIRKNGREYSMHTVSKPEAAAFELKDGDYVKVEEMLQRFSNMIEITGAVFYPGLYELGSKISTVGQLVAAAGGVVEEAFLNRAVLQHRNLDKTLENEPINLRGILDGSAPDVKLRNNDLLLIPNSADMIGEQTVGISGEVNLPGKYKFAKNTTIEDLILQAGGLTRAASVMKIDVYRNIIDVKSTEQLQQQSLAYSFSLKDGFMVDGGENFVLEPFDEVFVRRTPSYSTMDIVKVRGCVNYEGGYVMPSKDYRLSQLVKDAGGVTNIAYMKGACLYRKMTAEERKQREAAMKTAQIQMLEESMRDEDKKLDVALLDSLMQLKLNLGEVYPVAINLEEAVENPGSLSDVVLREGDILNIPEYSSTISISGEVHHPITVSYEKGKNVKYYIKHAGGYSNNAHKKGVYIIYMNGSVVNVSKSSSKVVEPGCEIVVPRKSMRNKLSPTEMATIGTSTASIATMIVAIINLLK